jgi:hypothetical protein
MAPFQYKFPLKQNSILSSVIEIEPGFYRFKIVESWPFLKACSFPTTGREGGFWQFIRLVGLIYKSTIKSA